MRVIRYQAEVIQVGCNSFQHADHPRPVENQQTLSRHLHRAEDSQPRFRHAPFVASQSKAASQHLNFSRQGGSDLGFRLRLFSFFLSTVTSARLSQLAQPDWNLLGFGGVEKLVDST
jgi:hypothetical protein